MHFNAGNCSLSCDRDYAQYLSVRATRVECTSGESGNISQVNAALTNEASVKPEMEQPLGDNEIFYKLKREIRSTGCLVKTRECLLHAIKFKSQSSILGILAGLKKDLIRLNTATEAQLRELNVMTTNQFYLAQHRSND